MPGETLMIFGHLGGAGIRNLILLLLLTASVSGLAGKTIPEMQAAGWQLTFDDEFDGPALDPAKWTPHYTHAGIINHELQAYVPDAFQFSNGILSIVAKHETGVQDGRVQQYRSGAMTTFGKFSQEYGYFEIRCKIPHGKGFWPAFWLLSDTNEWPPEIDVFENIGMEDHTLHFTNHWKNESGQHRAKLQATTGPDFTAGFHTVAADWEPGSITWYVDDVEQCRSTDHVPAEKMYLLVNLAVGGDWPKSPNAETQFPSSYDIDYVRVYQRAAKDQVQR